MLNRRFSRGHDFVGIFVLQLAQIETASLGDFQSAVDGVREIYVRPNVTDTFDLRFGEPDFAGVIEFLCGEREFSRERVTAALERAFAERTLW